MLKHYVRFYYPGSFVSEDAVRPLESREQPITLPERAYAYRLEDREESDEGGEVLVGKWKNIGPTVYIGEVLTLADVKRTMPGERILISNMEGNGYARVVKTRFGQCFPIQDGDEVRSA